MAIEKLIWRDEELAPTQTPSGADYEPRYNIIAANGAVVAAAAKPRLANEVRVAGTLHNADNMNKLAQKCDAVGSFFYRPLGGVPLYNFTQPVSASAWHTLAACPVEIGENQIVVAREGKFYVTLGRVENVLNYDVAVFDLAANSWQIHPVGHSKMVNLGGVADYRVVGNKLVVVSRDWDNVRPATAWMDALDLDDLSWTYGTTNTWAAHIRKVGPIRVSADGTHAIAAGRDGTQGNGAVDRFGPASSTPVQAGLLPACGGNTNYVPTGFVAVGGQNILTTPNGQVFRAPTFVGWQALAVANHGQGIMRTGVGDDDLRIFRTSQAVPRLFSLGGDMAVTARSTDLPTNGEVAAVGAGRCYFMVSGRSDAWEPSRRWRMLNVASGSVTELADAPANLAGFALCATTDGVFAVKGTQTYFGHFGEISQGVVVGFAFKGLSVSASGSLFLVNDRETITVRAGAWHECADDYLICAAPEMQVFGQVANL